MMINAGGRTTPHPSWHHGGPPDAFGAWAHPSFGGQILAIRPS
jgi:hypothetical protein